MQWDGMIAVHVAGKKIEGSPEANSGGVNVEITEREFVAMLDSCVHVFLHHFLPFPKTVYSSVCQRRCTIRLCCVCMCAVLQ